MSRDPRQKRTQSVLRGWGREFHWRELRGEKSWEFFLLSPRRRRKYKLTMIPKLGTSERQGASQRIPLVGANRHPIRMEEDLNRLLALSSPGDVVNLSVTPTDGNSSEVMSVRPGTVP